MWWAVLSRGHSEPRQGWQCGLWVRSHVLLRASSVCLSGPFLSLCAGPKLTTGTWVHVSHVGAGNQLLESLLLCVLAVSRTPGRPWDDPLTAGLCHVCPGMQRPVVLRATHVPHPGGSFACLRARLCGLGPLAPGSPRRSALQPVGHPGVFQRRPPEHHFLLLQKHCCQVPLPGCLHEPTESAF